MTLTQARPALRVITPAFAGALVAADFLTGAAFALAMARTVLAAFASFLAITFFSAAFFAGDFLTAFLGAASAAASAFAFAVSFLPGSFFSEAGNHLFS